MSPDFISCDLPVSPRSSQFELRPRLPSATTWQGTGGSPSPTDLGVGMDTLVRALNGHELLSCSGSAYTGLGASPSTNCELRERANCELQRNSRNLDRRGTISLNGERNGCPLVEPTIWDGVTTLIPISRAHPTPVGPGTYFVQIGQT